MDAIPSVVWLEPIARPNEAAESSPTSQQRFSVRSGDRKGGNFPVDNSVAYFRQAGAMRSAHLAVVYADDFSAEASIASRSQLR